MVFHSRHRQHSSLSVQHKPRKSLSVVDTEEESCSPTVPTVATGSEALSLSPPPSTASSSPKQQRHSTNQRRQEEQEKEQEHQHQQQEPKQQAQKHQQQRQRKQKLVHFTKHHTTFVAPNRVHVTVEYIPRKEELDAAALYYSRDEIHDMWETAKANARDVKEVLLRLVDLKMMATTTSTTTSSSNSHRHHHHRHDGSGSDYDSLLRLYEMGLCEASFSLRGLERWIVHETTASSSCASTSTTTSSCACQTVGNNSSDSHRKVAIQRILAIQDMTAVDVEQRQSLMRMRSLLESRKACHLAARMAAADALQVAAAATAAKAQ